MRLERAASRVVVLAPLARELVAGEDGAAEADLRAAVAIA
jgi:hypothetical protein